MGVEHARLHCGIIVWGGRAYLYGEKTVGAGRAQSPSEETVGFVMTTPIHNRRNPLEVGLGCGGVGRVDCEGVREVMGMTTSHPLLARVCRFRE